MNRFATTSALVGASWVASLAACTIERPASSFRGAVHGVGIADPKSPDFHGTLLRSKRWAPMLDAHDDQACGRCHAGAPATPTGITSSAPGATACTACHDRPEGPLACTTCHGDPPTSGAHAAHLAPSAASPAGFACATCHPMPGAGVIGGTHGNGSIEIAFGGAIPLREASYDPSTKTCAVSCHDHGGANARPSWADAVPSTCGNCHGAPPSGHFVGACHECHAEANAAGTALNGGPLHMNGRVDLGDGSGTCAACHGANGDPWPTTNAHPAHARPALTTPIACASCHVVPGTVLAKGHLDGTVNVSFAGRALDRGATPTWSGTQCSDVACHGANLPEAPAVVPTWSDPSHAASTCGACHGIPPAQHTPSTSCNLASCHGSEVARDVNGVPSITVSGRSVHIDGIVEGATP